MDFCVVMCKFVNAIRVPAYNTQYTWNTVESIQNNGQRNEHILNETKQKIVDLLVNLNCHT